MGAIVVICDEKLTLSRRLLDLVQHRQLRLNGVDEHVVDLVVFVLVAVLTSPAVGLLLDELLLAKRLFFDQLDLFLHQAHLLVFGELLVAEVGVPLSVDFALRRRAVYAGESGLTRRRTDLGLLLPPEPAFLQVVF